MIAVYQTSISMKSYIFLRAYPTESKCKMFKKRPLHFTGAQGREN
jgi:hypothetical protein